MMNTSTTSTARPPFSLADLASLRTARFSRTPNDTPLDWLESDDFVRLLNRPPLEVETHVPAHRPVETGLSGYLDIPNEQVMHPLEAYTFSTAEQPDDWFPEGVGTVDDLLEAYVKTQPEPVSVEDDRIHQLRETPDVVQRAVVLLRLFEEDVYAMKRLGMGTPATLAAWVGELWVQSNSALESPLRRKEVEIQAAMQRDRLTYVEAKWGSALNALAYVSHHRLIETLIEIDTAGKRQDLRASLTRMGYIHWIDQQGLLNLRHPTHTRLGNVIV